MFAFALDGGLGLKSLLPLAVDDFGIDDVEELLDVDIGVELVEVLHDAVHFGLRVEGDELLLLDLAFAVVVGERWLAGG